MSRGITLGLMLVLASACGSGSPAPDVGFDGGPEAGMDARVDARMTDARTLDASVDAGTPCASDADCHDAVDSVCFGGHCAPGVCFSAGDPAVDSCPLGYDCIYSRCFPSVCGACPSGHVCAPATHGCMAPADPVACRGAGGLYARGRCLLPGAGDDACAEGYVSEVLSAGCDVPSVRGATLGASNIARFGPFPVARLDRPAPGSLVAHRWVDGSHLLWRFDYVDPGIAPGVQETTLVLTPPAWASGAPTCLAPASRDFPQTALCERLPSASVFRCGNVVIEAVARDESDTLVLAGRDDGRLLHIEVLRARPRMLSLRQSYVSASPSGLWRPILATPGGAFFRVGMEAPLELIRIDSSGTTTWASHLASGPELALVSGYPYDILARDIGGALVSVGRGTLLAEAPMGPYSGRGHLVAHTSLPLPSTLRVYRRGTPSAPGEPEPIIAIAEEPTVGLAVDTHMNRAAAVVAAIPLDAGGWGLDEIAISDSGVSTHRPLIRPSDVGGTIVDVTDLAAHVSGDPCGDFGFQPVTLVGAMLDIRLADGSVVHELWAVAIKGQ